MSIYTAAAGAFVTIARVTRDRMVLPLTWLDIAAAYDAGLRHGVDNRMSGKKQLRVIDKQRRELETPT